MCPTPKSRNAAPRGSNPRRNTPPACWANTRSRWAPPPGAPSPTNRRPGQSDRRPGRCSCSDGPGPNASGATMKIASATPVLFADRVEPTRDFFARVGFKVAFDVPEGDRVGFAMVTRDGVNVMIETRGNANEPAALQALSRESRRAVVFVEVDDLEAVI